MSDKIRIIGSFGPDILDKVAAFTDSIGPVEYVSVLKDGVEQLPASAPPAIDPTAPDAPAPPPILETPTEAPAPDAAPAA